MLVTYQESLLTFIFPHCISALFIYLFTCNLWNSAVSDSDYIALMRDLNLLF
jgi:hypothetical protein